MVAKKDFAAAKIAVEDAKSSYVRTFEEAKRRIEDFELNTTTKFASWRTVKFLQDGEQAQSTLYM